jgi:hypothetical protein
MRILKRWFKELVGEQVVLTPAPVVLDVDTLSRRLVRDLRIMVLASLREAIIEAKKPPEPVTGGEGFPSDIPVDPTLESELLAKLHVNIQEAARYACRKVQRDPSHPPGGRTLGNNWHRDEACEWAKIWLNERALAYRDSDVNLACELYYRVYIKEIK